MKIFYSLPILAKTRGHDEEDYRHDSCKTIEQSKASRQPCPKVIDAPKYLRADILAACVTVYVYIIMIHNIDILCILSRKQFLSQSLDEQSLIVINVPTRNKSRSLTIILHTSKQVLHGKRHYYRCFDACSYMILSCSFYSYLGRDNI